MHSRSVYLLNIVAALRKRSWHETQRCWSRKSGTMLKRVISSRCTWVSPSDRYIHRPRNIVLEGEDDGTRNGNCRKQKMKGIFAYCQET